MLSPSAKGYSPFPLPLCSTPLCAACVSLIEGRRTVANILKLPHSVDLVIPRGLPHSPIFSSNYFLHFQIVWGAGSASLLQHMQSLAQNIPVLGHADGICHLYIDKDADVEVCFRPDRYSMFLKSRCLDCSAGCCGW